MHEQTILLIVAAIGLAYKLATDLAKLLASRHQAKMLREIRQLLREDYLTKEAAAATYARRGALDTIRDEWHRFRARYGPHAAPES
jgi:hypothetical protein